jgi:hypothetical protein
VRSGAKRKKRMGSFMIVVHSTAFRRALLLGLRTGGCEEPPNQRRYYERAGL